MNGGKRRQVLSYIPGYTNNKLLQLIFFIALCYIMLALSWSVLLLVYNSAANYDSYFLPSLAIPGSRFLSHWWTIFTYGIFHYPNGFMGMASNMLWLYCFGSVVQSLIGPKQIIPLFFYCLFFGGIAYIGASMLPGALGHSPTYLLGPKAGMIGMAAAAITLAPHHRFYLSETFSIPIMAVAGVFGVLMIIGSGFYLSVIVLLLAGGITGFLYIRSLQAGYRPANWIYTITGKIEGLVTPDENVVWKKHSAKRNQILNNYYRNQGPGASKKTVDDILDKINQKGYNSLTKEEKAILMQVSKE